MTGLPEEVEHIYQNHHLDTTRWNYFTPRDDDIIISTSYKAGTTFTQTIVGNMLFPDGNLPGPATDISPWLDNRVMPLELVLGQLEAQEHRRYIKSHLPLDGLRFFENVKYICITRDPRDVFMSLLNHWGSHTEAFYALINGIMGLVGEPFPHFVDDTKATWRNWMTRGSHEWETDGYPYWSHLDHALSFWKYRDLPNIMMLHYADLLSDLDGEMRRIADYLEIAVPDEHWDDVVKRCTFAEVKKNPGAVIGEEIGLFFEGGADAFINKGTNDRWVGVLDDEDLALYDKAMSKLPEDYAHWLQNGGPVS